jgi:hypothetical protein
MKIAECKDQNAKLGSIFLVNTIAFDYLR